jgi:hypothetical protein
MRMKSLLPWVVPVALAACGSKGPPPRVAEVPIDLAPPHPQDPAMGQNQTDQDPMAALSALGASGALGSLGAGGTAGAGAPPGLSGGGAGLLPAMTPGIGPGMPGGMTPMPGGTPAAAGASSSPKAPLPKGERLSEKECRDLMDKYIELVGISQGISPGAIGSVMDMLRNSVANDPNYSGALGACAKENSKTQYRCAMRANDVDTWQRCLK